MKKQKPTSEYKAFGKRFFKVLTGSVLSVLLVYGGIVWASGNACELYQSNSNSNITVTGNNLSSSSGWSFLRKICQQVIHNSTAEVNIENEDNESIGKLRVKNKSTNSDRNHFISFKTDRERNSFLNAANNGSISSEIDVCEVGGDGNAFGNGVEGCEEGDISCVQDAVCNSDLDCNGGTCGAEPVIAFGGSNNCNGFYFNNSATSCQGTPTGNTKLDWQGNAFDWQYGYIYYLNNSGNPQAIAICGADATVGNNIGIGVGPTPNGYTQCIIETHIPAGNYYQVYQFESQINYWQQFTVDNDDVITNVFQTEQFALGNATQSCNGANQSSCESVTGCNWEATDDKVSCAGATNKASCEVQASTCSWSGPVSVRL